MDIEDKIVKMAEALGRIESKLDDINNSVKKHDAIIFGNGKWGIKAQVNILWGILIFIIGVLIKMIYKLI